jgi:replication-associated recombination protein RarA
MLPDTVRGSKFNPLLESLLFPSLDKLYPEMRPSPNAFFNFRIRDGINRNVEQFNAVNAIVNKTHDDSIFILFGPPGTGEYCILRILAYLKSQDSIKNYPILQEKQSPS